MEIKTGEEIVASLEKLQSEYSSNFNELMRPLYEFANDSTKRGKGTYYFQEGASDIEDVSTSIDGTTIIIRYIDRFGDKEHEYVNLKLFNDWVKDKNTAWKNEEEKMRQDRISDLKSAIESYQNDIEACKRELKTLDNH